MNQAQKRKLLIAVASTGQEFLDNIFSLISEDIENPESSDSCTSSSEEDDQIDEIIAILNCKTKKKPSQIENYVEFIIPNYLEAEFKQHFRLSRNAFEITLNLVTENVTVESQSQTGLEKQLLAVLWLLATHDSYRSVGDRFDLDKSSLSKIFVRVINALNKSAPTIIKWPAGQDIILSTQKFKESCGMDNVIGVIDGTYVRMKPPPDQYQSYTNRKMFQSMTLQAVCDHKMKFIDCFTGYPSSVHDSRILWNSHLYQNVESNTTKYFPGNELILGGKGYTLLPWLLTPYVDRGGLSHMQKQFNKKHATGRHIIKRSYALLFGRFRRLQNLDMDRIDWIPATILACCVLHNLCIDCNDSVEVYISEGQETAQTCSTRNGENQYRNNINAEVMRDTIAFNLV